MSNSELLTGLGAAAALFLSSAGACAASAPAGIYALKASHHGIKSFVPIVIGGVLAIYGIIVAVILSSKMTDEPLSVTSGYKLFSAGLSVGLACLASGFGMARFLQDAMTTTFSKSSNVAPESQPLLASNTSGSTAESGAVPPPTWQFMCVMVFLEAIGLYGLIVALILAS